MINWSHRNPVSRIHIPVGVAYGSNIGNVRKAILEACQDHPDVLSYPQPQVWFKGFGNSSLDFELLVWLSDPQKQERLKSDLNYQIEASLRRYQVEIPFPQRDLHVRSPQLEQLIQILIEKHHPSQPQIYYPNQMKSPMTFSTLQPEEGTQTIDPLSSTHSTHWIDEMDLEHLAEQMQGPEGLEIKDRRFRLILYSKCFVGSEAVQWLMKTQKASREEAIRLGQLMVDQGLIHHVVDEQPFLDQYLFYRFRKPISSEPPSNPKDSSKET